MRTRLLWFCLVYAFVIIAPGVAAAHGHGGGQGFPNHGQGHWDHGHGGWHGHDGHGHGHFGFFFGAPFIVPFLPPPPVYAAPAPQIMEVVPPQSEDYVEQQSAPQASTENWWYYCSNPQGYYPYVRECQDGWQRVAPQPPGTVQ